MLKSCYLNEFVYKKNHVFVTTIKCPSEPGPSVALAGGASPWASLLLQVGWSWGTGSSLSQVLPSHASVILQQKQTRPAEVPRLQLSSGFVWDVGLDSLTPALPPRGDSSDSEEDEKPQQATVRHILQGFVLYAGTP